MAKQEKRSESKRRSRRATGGNPNSGKLMVRVLPEDGSGRFRRIDPADVRYYFTRSAWLQGVITRKWIAELFRNGSAAELHWRDVPIRGDGIFVRTEEAVFRLVGMRSLREVAKEVGGELLRPHESALVNDEWLHDYSSVHAEIGVLVDGADGKPQTERVQVSIRHKKPLEERLFKRRPKRPRTKPGAPSRPGSR